MNSENKIPSWFKTVAIVALVWNVLGLIAFFTQFMMTDEMLAMMPDDQREAFENTPIWATLVFALAVVGGTLGSIFLLMKKKLAAMMFLVSLIGIVLQDFYNFFVIDSIGMMGASSVAMPIMVLAGGIALFMLSRKATAKGWIN